MSYTYRYHARTDTFITRLQGEITDEIIVAGVKRRSEDPNNHEGVRHFIDCADVDKFDVSKLFVAGLQSVVAQNPRQGKRAFFAFSPAGSTKHEQLVREISKDAVVAVFYNRAKAVEWLNEGVPADKKLTVDDTMPEN